MFTLLTFVPLSIIIFVAMIIRRRSLFLSRIRVKWLIGSYVTVLIISTLFLPLFLNMEIRKQDERNGETLRIETTDGEYTLENAVLQQELEFELSSRTLVVKSMYDDYIPLDMLIEQKTTDDSVCELLFYYEETAASDRRPFSFHHSKNELYIGNEEQLLLKFATFTNEFTIKQFTKEAHASFRPDELDDMLGKQLILIRVPKGTDVTVEAAFDSVLYTGS